MATAVKVSDELFKNAKIKSKIFKRSIAGQIEYWAKIGQMIEDNPELPLPFLQDILVGREQIKVGQGTPYVFGEESWRYTGYSSLQIQIKQSANIISL